MATNRRAFLRGAVGASAAGLAAHQLGFDLPAVSGSEASLDPRQVRLESGIEPLVHLLEETPRAELLERVAAQVHGGVSYQHVLAALMLAAVRNVQPRPSVGFKFHAVLVVNSAHLASLAAPDSDRWLPIFWALDYFKAKQLEEARNSGWKLGPVDEQRVPSPGKAAAAFHQAMERWDADAADAAISGWVRCGSPGEIFESFFRLGARDFRSIGHKAIFVANAYRTLQCIGWQHAEPILRSLAYALTNHQGDANPSKSDLEPDRPWRLNQELARTWPADWRAGTVQPEASLELVGQLREATSAEAAQAVATHIQNGLSPTSAWDALFLASGELLMQQPGIIGLHTLTTANALQHAAQATSDEFTQRMMLLQAASFLPLFRKSAKGRGRLGERTLQDLLKSESEGPATAADAVEAIFAEVSRSRLNAAASILNYVQQGGTAESILDQARRLVFAKGNDAHDYKYSSAVLEDYYNVSPQLRAPFLALSVFNLPGSGDKDNQLIERVRAVLGNR